MNASLQARIGEEKNTSNEALHHGGGGERTSWQPDLKFSMNDEVADDTARLTSR
jgi:hypothetical protein